MKTTKYIIETSYGYNVQVSTPQGHVLGNASDGVRFVAERDADRQAIERGATPDTMTTQFISTIN